MGGRDTNEVERDACSVRDSGRVTSHDWVNRVIRLHLRVGGQ